MSYHTHDSATSRAGARGWGAALVLVALSVAIYHRVIGFELITAWDDGLFVLHRPEVQDWFAASWTQRLLTPEIGYPIPLPTFFYYLLRQLPADWIVPAAHGLNLVVHAGSVVLAYLLARRWMGLWPAFIAVALWASHPLLVESVAWATNLKVVTFAAFALGGVLAWQHNLEAPSRALKAVALGCVVGAMLCRPEGFMLPAVYALFTLWSRAPREVFEAHKSWPIWVSALLAVIYVPVAHLGHQAELAATLPDVSLGVRLERMGAALTTQLGHVLQPFELHPGYYADYAGVRADAWLGLGVALVLGAVTVFAWRRRHLAFVGLGLFWLFYLPASGIALLPRFTADTYMYLPLFGLTLAGVAVVHGWLEDKSPIATKVAVGAGALAIAALSLVAHLQTLRWQNGVTLWEPVIAAYPDQAQPYWIVGRTYAHAELHEEALELFLAGEEAFYARGRVPLAMAEELLRAGRVEHAVDVAITLLTYEGLEDPAAGLFLAWVIVEHDVELDDHERYDQALVEAARRVVEASPDWPPEAFDAFAERLDERGLDEWAERVRGVER